MKSLELKQAIKEDLETIKNLDLDIMDPKEYYRLHRFLFIKVILIYYFVAFIGCFLFSQTGLNLPVIFIPIIPTLMIFFMHHLSMLNDYIIFYYQIRPKLKTGDLIAQKIKKAVRLYFALYIPAVWGMALFVGHIYTRLSGGPYFSEFELYFKPAFSCSFPVGGFLVCMLIVQSIIELELKRVGISTLFSMIQKYFSPDEEEAKKLNWPERKNHYD